MKKLYKFYWDCGRQGSVEGMFIAEEKKVQEVIGQEVNFGEILGKHSEVSGIIEEGEIKEVKVSEITVKEMAEIIGTTISGYNPLRYIQYNCSMCDCSYPVNEVEWYINEDGEKICECCAEDIDKETLVQL